MADTARWLVLGLASLPVLLQAAWNVQTGWESQYISEGRRALEESGGLLTGILVFEEGPWFVEAWNGVNTAADFWEIDVSVGGALAWGPLELSSGLTLVKVWQEGEEEKPDHECFLGAALPLSETTEVTVDFVCSRLASGTYVECGLSQALPAPDGLDWSIYGAVAWDFGYASEAFDGISHAQLGTEVSLAVGKGWGATVFALLTLPFEDLEQDGGTSAGSLGLSVGRGF